jgi:hypothetical protein
VIHFIYLCAECHYAECHYSDCPWQAFQMFVGKAGA